MFSKFEIRPRNKKSTTDLIVNGMRFYVLRVDDTVDDINNEHKHRNRTTQIDQKTTYKPRWEKLTEQENYAVVKGYHSETATTRRMI